MSKFKFSHAAAMLTALLLAVGIAAVVRADQSAAAPTTAATGSLTGKVVDSSGQPVGGAIVRLALMPENMGGPHHRWHKPQPGQTTWHTMTFGVTATADDGTFTVNNAPVGRYRIMAFARQVGNGHIGRPVAVSAGQNVDAGTITLAKPQHHGMRQGPPPGPPPGQ